MLHSSENQRKTTPLFLILQFRNPSKNVEKWKGDPFGFLGTLYILAKSWRLKKLATVIVGTLQQKVPTK